MSVIGFDIGTYAAKALLLSVKGKGQRQTVTIEGLGMSQMPLGVMTQWEDQPIPARTAMSAAMRSLVKHCKLSRGRHAALSLSGETMILKKITMPVTTQKELRNSLSMEAEQYIPYPINEVIIDGHILGTDDRYGQMSVLLVAARKEVVFNYIQAVALTKSLKPAVIDVDALAFFNAYDFIFPANRDNVALVDIGASMIHITLLQDGTPHTIKEENIGGQRLTEDLEDAFGVQPEEAESIKLGTVQAPDPKEAAEIVDRLASNWLAAVERAVDSVKSEQGDYNLDRILLAGGCANLNGLPEHFRRHFNVPTEVFNPLKNLKSNPKKFDRAYLDYIGPQMAVSFGLAIRKPEIN
ncbi:MAG: type IV pilus assembly protein PilM [Deltaproteobacteria bacterium]|jgi:type IV pilus assembly protein PilM|nr:type IV pilus assembly protein PilM [Deltaproteobacteria bacterium]